MIIYYNVLYSNYILTFVFMNTKEQMYTIVVLYLIESKNIIV